MEKKIRGNAFGESRLSILDRFIFWLRARKIKKYIGNDFRVVADFGCGYNADLLQSILKEKDIDSAIGVDLSINDQLSLSNLKKVNSDLNKEINIKSESVDMIISLAVLEHLSDTTTFVKEINRILTFGGTLLLTTPSPLAKPVLEFMAYKLGIIDKYEIEDHKHYFSKEELYSLFATAGFKDIYVSTFLFKFNNIVICKK